MASQIEQSSELYNFFKLNGAPQAFRLRTPIFGDLRLELYYPERQVVYSSSGKKKQAFFIWEEPKPDEGLWNLAAVDLIDHKSIVPVFTVWDTEMRFAYYPELRSSAGKIARSESALEFYRDTNIKTYTNSDASRFSQGLAEKNTQGDILHRVKTQSENLMEVSEWYTGSSDNVLNIAAYNKIPANAELQKGQLLVIPASLISNEKIKVPVNQ